MTIQGIIETDAKTNFLPGRYYVAVSNEVKSEYYFKP